MINNNHVKLLPELDAYIPTTLFGLENYGH
jgi:hypothetical protein